MSSEKTTIPPEHCWTSAAAALLATKRTACPAGHDAERTAWVTAVSSALGIKVELLPEAVTESDVAAFPSLPADKHAELLQLLILASLSVTTKPSKQTEQDRAYSALSRALVFETARLLRIDSADVDAAEHAVAQQLYAMLEKSDSTQALSSASRQSVDTSRSSKSALKWAATGAGFVLGGVAIGLTGGLAAVPLFAATGGLLGIFSGAAGAVALGSLLGVAGGGMTAYRTKRRMDGIESFEFEQVTNTSVPSLHATIVMSGLLLKPEDYISPFRAAFADTHDRDVYAIKTDIDDYLATGQKVQSYVLDFVIKKGAVEVVKRTALAAIYTAVALPVAVYNGASMFLDNRWQRTKDKAYAAGRVLADVLAEEVQGKRPVTLIGSSLGAVTIFSCLLELHKRGLDNLVFDVVVISSPMAPSPDDYAKARSVVSHRFVNANSSNDWVLALLARLHTLSYSVAGIQALPDNVKALGIESLDVSDLLPAHLQLADKLPEILARVNL